MTVGYKSPVWARIYQQSFAGHSVAMLPAIAEYYATTPQRDNRVALDVCCGTGDMCGALAARGYTVTGVDVSRAMLQIAGERQAEFVAKHQIDLLESDARTFQLGETGNVGLATIMLDSVNLMPTGDDLGHVFEAIAEALAPGGTLVFDMLTARGMREQWVGGWTFEGANHLTVVQGIMDEAGRTLTRQTGFGLSDAGVWERFEEQSARYVHATEDVLGYLTEAGFVDAWPASVDALGKPLPSSVELGRIFVVATR